MRVRCRQQNLHKVTKVYTYCPLFAPFFIKKGLAARATKRHEKNKNIER